MSPLHRRALLCVASAALAVSCMPLQSFNGPDVPRNHQGSPYPDQYPGAGTGTVRIDPDGVTGSALALDLTGGYFYAQFNPREPNGLRGFAREYVTSPAAWRFDYYNRLSFWIRAPVEAMPLLHTGQENMHLGTYVKEVADPDPYTDETGNNHWYHHLNITNTGTWTRVIVNMHPDHLRDTGGDVEHGNQPHPTGEPDYNYFDALTRFYVSQQRQAPASYPATFGLDDFLFYRETRPENDEQVYSIAATFVAAENRLVLTWNRHKDENAVRHEVRYSFSDIHSIGWEAATPAPGGLVRPLGWQGYNGMLYETTEVPLQDRGHVFLAIKPENSDLFSQIWLPLTLA